MIITLPPRIRRRRKDFTVEQATHLYLLIEATLNQFDRDNKKLERRIKQLEDKK